MNILQMWYEGRRIIRKWFKPKTKIYTFEGMVQYDEHNNLTVCGCSVRWLGKVLVEDISEEAAEKVAFKILAIDYPEYGDMILIG